MNVRQLILIGACAGALLGCSGQGGAVDSGPGSEEVISGTVMVPAYAGSTASNCEPWTGLLDVVPGAKVTITNQAGDIVGATTLVRTRTGGIVDHTPAASADILGSLWDKSCV